MARKLVTKRGQGDGAIRKLPSRRYQARFRNPEGNLIPAPITFETRADAEAWLAGSRPAEIEAARVDPLLSDFAEQWWTDHEMKPRTRAHYRKLLDVKILPVLGQKRLSKITVDTVKDWHRELGKDTPTMTAHAYGLLHTIMGAAWREDRITANPCRIFGGGNSKTRHKVKTATNAEIEVMVAAIPARYRAMILLAAIGGLRFGEITELRRKDIDATAIRVSRGVARADGVYVVGGPKSDAGRRTIDVAEDLAQTLAEHLAEHVGPGPDALLFPAAGDPDKHLAPATFYRVYYPARAKAGRPDLHFHDLRHTAGTNRGRVGSTLGELKDFLGHGTLSAATIYMHTAEGRGATLAARVAALKDGE